MYTILNFIKRESIPFNSISCHRKMASTIPTIIFDSKTLHYIIHFIQGLYIKLLSIIQRLIETNQYSAKRFFSKNSNFDSCLIIIHKVKFVFLIKGTFITNISTYSKAWIL
jgi:hypothetical protein